ncbi:MAG: hypothetical protein M0Z67_10865 [Nitrospiraceae bacterium]|nr:hypothetical protein [Nitrospiraceae bacterium]
MKKNCWEVKGCGQQRRGHKNSLVKCPVPEMTSADGINDGKNAGRICWLIANTMCKGATESTFEAMITTCGECDFYNLVKAEGGEKVMLSIDMLREVYEKNRLDNSNRKAKKSK